MATAERDTTPYWYLAGVAKAFIVLGGGIHEHSEVDKFCDDPRRVKANGHTATCVDVVIATHNPFVGLAGTWWDTADPYQFLRVEPHRDYDVVIFGGEDHKTGQPDVISGPAETPLPETK